MYGECDGTRQPRGGWGRKGTHGAEVDAAAAPEAEHLVDAAAPRQAWRLAAGGEVIFTWPCICISDCPYKTNMVGGGGHNNDFTAHS
jgi:hypothetical protein